MFQRGFDILVRKDFGYMLPTEVLSSTSLEGWQLKFLETMDNWTVANLCGTLRRKPISLNEDENHFVRQLLQAITALANKMDRTFFQNARLIARLLRAPAATSDDAQADVFVLAFRIMTDIHQKQALVDPYEFAPAKFFLVQQHAYKNSPDNQIFARRIHREFAAVAEDHANWASNPLTRRYTDHSVIDCHSRSAPRILKSRSISPAKARPSSSRKESSTSNRTVGSMSDFSEKSRFDPIQRFGGIHVSNEVSVSFREVKSGDTRQSIDLTPLGCSAKACVGDVESETFADELMTMTLDERRSKRFGPAG